MNESPFPVRFESGPGKGNAVHATLTLRNEADTPRWLVLSASLDARLSDAFEAQVVQLCSFESTSSLQYLQALGTESGFVAFRLGAGTSLSLDSFALRSYGGTTLDIWAVADIHADGTALGTIFPALTPLAEVTTVRDAYKRATSATHEQKPCAVTLDVIQRWTVTALSLQE